MVASMALPAFSFAMAQPRVLISLDLWTFNRTEASRRACGPGIVPETSRLSVAIRCRYQLLTAGQGRFRWLGTPRELARFRARLGLRVGRRGWGSTWRVGGGSPCIRPGISPSRWAGGRPPGMREW